MSSGEVEYMIDAAIAEFGFEDEPRRCIFDGCVSTDRHWHGSFPGGYTNPDNPYGPPIPFTSEPAPGVRDYNGALLKTDSGATRSSSEAGT